MKKKLCTFVLLFVCSAVFAQLQLPVNRFYKFFNMNCDSIQSVLKTTPQMTIDSVNFATMGDTLFSYEKISVFDGREDCRLQVWKENNLAKQLALEIPLNVDREDFQYKYLKGLLFENNEPDYHLPRYKSLYDVYVVNQGWGGSDWMIYKVYGQNHVTAVILITKESSFLNSYLKERSPEFVQQKISDKGKTGKWKLYSTQNIYTSLLLNTCTGAIDIVQWSLKREDGYEYRVSLCGDQAWSDLNIIGRYELYPTSNIYQFILVDTILGTTYHVQWGTSDEMRWIRKIY